MLAVGDHLPHQAILCVLQLVLGFTFQLCVLFEGIVGIRQGHFQFHGALTGLATVGFVHDDGKSLAGGVVYLFIDDRDFCRVVTMIRLPSLSASRRSLEDFFSSMVTTETRVWSKAGG